MTQGSSTIEVQGRECGLPLHEPFGHTWERAWRQYAIEYRLPVAVVLGWRDARKLRKG